jgi:hypothetical protein
MSEKGDFVPLVDSVTYIKEPDSLQCGQAVLAMLLGKTVDEIIETVGTERETKLKDMFCCLDLYGVKYSGDRVQVESKSELPEICFLSLETPRCWHWSLYFKGMFYDPEHGVMNDFPECNRKYYWRIF